MQTRTNMEKCHVFFSDFSEVYVDFMQTRFPNFSLLAFDIKKLIQKIQIQRMLQYIGKNTLINLLKQKKDNSDS
jgi:hypothetical protein